MKAFRAQTLGSLLLAALFLIISSSVTGTGSETLSEGLCVVSLPTGCGQNAERST